MFYAQFILAKKGPLAKIWLAAHWESKLSKAQILETDLSSAAHEIAQPKVKMALRTSGYLLLGLMRIYKKKGHFLYNDCKEAVLRIKTSLNPDKINWEKDEEHVAQAMGAEGIMPDFDITPHVVDISALKHPNVFDQIEQLPIDQITLQDHNFNEPEHPQIGADDFGEIAAGLMDVDEPINRSLVEGARAASFMSQNVRLSQSEQPLPVELMEVDENVPKKDAGQFDFGTDLELDQMFNDQQPLESTRISEGLLVEREKSQDSFALEPILEDQELAITRKAPTKRRRRKLLIDESPSISNEEMMLNIRDFSDIVHAQVELAPPTKALMKIREIGSTDKLLINPCASDNLDSSIQRIYSSHISVFKAMDPSKRRFLPPDDDEDVENMSSIVGGSSERVSEIENMRMSIPSFGLEPEADELQLELPPLDLRELDGLPPPTDLSFNEPMSPAPLQNRENFLQDISNRILNSQPLDSQVLDNLSVADLLSQSPAQFKENLNPNRDGDRADALLEPTTPGTYAKKRKEQHKMSLRADEDEVKDLRFTRQTQSVFDSLTLRFKQTESTTISELLTKHSTQKVAAQRFYALLVLAKYGAIEVEQNHSYEEIIITKGEEYRKYLGKIDEFKK